MQVVIDIFDKYPDLPTIGYQGAEDANIHIDGSKELVEEMKELVERYCEEQEYYIR